MFSLLSLPSPQAVRRGLGVATALVLALALMGTASAAPLAPAASAGSLAHTVHLTGQAVLPAASGGGCNTYFDQKIPIHIGACINYTSSNNKVNADAYVGPICCPRIDKWTSCQVRVSLAVESSGVLILGSWQTCLPAMQCPCQYHYFGPSFGVQPGGEYQTVVDWSATYNGVNDHSPSIWSPTLWT